MLHSSINLHTCPSIVHTLIHPSIHQIIPHPIHPPIHSPTHSPIHPHTPPAIHAHLDLQVWFVQHNELLCLVVLPVFLVVDEGRQLYHPVRADHLPIV